MHLTVASDLCGQKLPNQTSGGPLFICHGVIFLLLFFPPWAWYVASCHSQDDWVLSKKSFVSCVIALITSHFLRGLMVAGMLKSLLDIKQQQLNRPTQNRSSYFEIRRADMSSSESILCETRQWLACCLSCALSLFLSLSPFCLCMCFQILRYHRTGKSSARQTDAAGAVRPLWNAPALRRSSWELYCVGQLAAAQFGFPKTQGLAASHNNEHLCGAVLLSLHVTVNDSRG